MKKYRIQSILCQTDNRGHSIDTITHSYTTNEWPDALAHLMKTNRGSGSFLYNVLDLETGELLISTKENPYRI